MMLGLDVKEQAFVDHVIVMNVYDWLQATFHMLEVTTLIHTNVLYFRIIVDEFYQGTWMYLGFDKTSDLLTNLKKLSLLLP